MWVRIVQKLRLKNYDVALMKNHFVAKTMN